MKPLLSTIVSVSSIAPNCGIILKSFPLYSSKSVRNSCHFHLQTWPRMNQTVLTPPFQSPPFLTRRCPLTSTSTHTPSHRDLLAISKMPACPLHSLSLAWTYCPPDKTYNLLWVCSNVTIWREAPGITAPSATATLTCHLTYYTCVYLPPSYVLLPFHTLCPQRNSVWGLTSANWFIVITVQHRAWA